MVKRVLYVDNILYRNVSFFSLKYKCIHHHKVACTSGHHKQMEDLMASEIFVLAVKEWKLQGIDYTANSL